LRVLRRPLRLSMIFCLGGGYQQPRGINTDFEYYKLFSLQKSVGHKITSSNSAFSFGSLFGCFSFSL
jgi:hypothetical protein